MNSNATIYKKIGKKVIAWVHVSNQPALQFYSLQEVGLNTILSVKLSPNLAGITCLSLESTTGGKHFIVYLLTVISAVEKVRYGSKGTSIVNIAYCKLFSLLYLYTYFVSFKVLCVVMYCKKKC